MKLIIRDTAEQASQYLAEYIISMTNPFTAILANPKRG